MILLLLKRQHGKTLGLTIGTLYCSMIKKNKRKKEKRIKKKVEWKQRRGKGAERDNRETKTVYENLDMKCNISVPQLLSLVK